MNIHCRYARIVSLSSNPKKATALAEVIAAMAPDRNTSQAPERIWTFWPVR
jgi:hypothetical protein